MAEIPLSLKKIYIESDAGDILIKKVVKASVEAQKIAFDKEDQLDFTLHKETLRIYAHKKSSKQFQVDLEIALPQGVDMEIELGAGNITTKRPTINTKLHLGAGDIRATEIKGKTDIHLGVGNIMLSHEKLTKKHL